MIATKQFYSIFDTICRMILSAKKRPDLRGFTLLFVLFPILLPCLGGKSFALEPERKMHNYIHTQWTTRNGLPQDSVTSITQDTKGYLWLGTENGLVRFDGKRVEIFNMKNTPALKSNHITVVFNGGARTLWIGTNGGGITKYKYWNNRFSRDITTRHIISNIVVRAIAGDDQNTTWVGTAGSGLLRFQGESMVAFTTGNGLADNIVQAVECGKNGDLWIGTANGLNRLKREIPGESATKSKTRFIYYTTRNGLPSNNITAVGEDHLGNLWVGTVKGLAKKEKKSSFFTRVPVPQKLRENWIHGIHEDNDGLIWVAGNSGLYRVRQTYSSGRPSYGIDNASIIDGFPKLPVLTLWEDNEGIIWSGTAGGGLNSIRNGGFNYFNSLDGLSDNYVNVVYQDSADRLWIGSKNGLSLFTGKRFSDYTGKLNLSSFCIQAIVEDKEGNLWLGTQTGLNRVKNNSVTVFTEKDGLTKNSVTALHTDRKGTVWIGTAGGGLNGFRNGDFFVPGTDKKRVPTNAFVQCMAEDRIGFSLWVGTNRGLYCLKNDRLKPFDAESELATYSIKDIYVDEGGTLWLGTEGKGLLCLSVGHIIPYLAYPQFTSASIYKIMEDGEQNLWMSSNRGFFYVDKREINTLPTQRMRRQVKFFQLLKGHGLKVPVFTCSGHPSGFKTKAGELWFPTVNGLVMIPPDHTSLQPPRLKVIIEKILVDGKEVPRTDEQTFTGPLKSMVFHFSALNLRPMEKLKVKCRLTNRSHVARRQWVRMEEGNRVTFTDLPKGRYYFFASACNGEGDWHELGVGDSFAFTVETNVDSSDIYIFFGIIILPILMVVMSRVMAKRAKKNEIIRIFKDDARYKTSAVKGRQVKKYLAQLLKVMEEEKPYLDPNMTVAKLAERLNVSKEHISQAVNQELYINFNHFLNRYRIEEAKKKLKDPAEQQFVLLKIAYDVGFNSKSTFNAAFKKITGMNPSQYRDKYQQEVREKEK